MLLSLATIDSFLVCSFCRIDDKNAAVSLAGTSDHVGNEVLVTWVIQDCVVTSLCLKMRTAHVDGDASFSFFLVCVKYESMLECVLTMQQRLTLVLVNLL